MPIVKRLGYEYHAEESVDDRELRTVAITQAVRAGDEAYVHYCISRRYELTPLLDSVIAELTGRFKKAVETGDDSCIPPDLVRITYKTVSIYSTCVELLRNSCFLQAVHNGGKSAYDKVVAIVQKPKNPSVGIAAMLAMGASTDLSLAGASDSECKLLDKLTDGQRKPGNTS